MIERLLIANRGEIAVRIARGARELGIAPLGVYSEADRGSMHLEFMADSACIGPPAVTSSYLNMCAILEAAQALRADAIHPGYGFLSERSEFARAVVDA
ncbi:MAG: acetyl-CoA carboxylase biotin carboxylase subunit, partial [Candidatus Eremiobacteraeota bacterium]|nr:acetyl-CoA carboxylase biotin carboxylase subunit [Candidatus Eremiobacteraeota bacterium]